MCFKQLVVVRLIDKLRSVEPGVDEAEVVLANQVGTRRRERGKFGRDAEFELDGQEFREAGRSAVGWITAAISMIAPITSWVRAATARIGPIAFLSK